MIVHLGLTKSVGRTCEGSPHIAGKLILGNVFLPIWASPEGCPSVFTVYPKWLLRKVRIEIAAHFMNDLLLKSYSHLHYYWLLKPAPIQHASSLCRGMDTGSHIRCWLRHTSSKSKNNKSIIQMRLIKKWHYRHKRRDIDDLEIAEKVPRRWSGTKFGS